MATEYNSANGTVTYKNGKYYQNDQEITAPSLTLPTYTGTATYNAPADYVAPTYTAPTYDENEIAALAQKRAAPGLRAARQALQQSTGGYFDNPNVKAMTLRNALAGYGLTVENVMSGADSDASSEYKTKYNIAADAAKTNYNAEVEAGKLNYNADVTKAEKEYEAALAAEKANYDALVSQYTANYNTQLSSYMADIYGTGVTDKALKSSVSKEVIASTDNTNATPQFKYNINNPATWWYNNI